MGLQIPVILSTLYDTVA